MVSVEELQRFDLFQTMPVIALETLAERTDRVHFPAGTPIFKQGEVGDYFYVIWFGRIAVYRNLETGGRELLNELGAGEFFGEEALLSQENLRNATVEAQSPVDVLRFDRSTFLGLWRGYPEWKDTVSNTIRLRAQFGSSFPEREPDEVGLVLVHRHPYALIEAILPIIAAAFVAILLFVFLATSIRLPASSSILIWIILATGIGIASLWIYLDWRNDLLIVTSKRVVHIERVFMYSESRVASPIEQVRTVTTRTPTTLARLLGYQDLVIQTGSTIETIIFTSVENAEQIVTKILNARDKAVSRREREDQRDINQQLRLRFNLPVEAKPDLTGPVRRTDQETGSQERQSRLWQVIHYFFPPLANKQRNRIVWRRHWYILLQKTILPVLIFLILAGFTVRLVSDPSMMAILESPLLLIIFIVVWGGVLFGLFWQYEDWYNDYYIATNSQIIDRYSLPFGFQERREVITFEAVQNVRADIPMWTHKLLNMGHVYIDTIGGVKPTKFDSVYDPLGIQQEIFDRLEAQRARRRREEVMQRSEELSDWFAGYREVIDQSRSQLGSVPPDGEATSQPRSAS